MQSELHVMIMRKVQVASQTEKQSYPSGEDSDVQCVVYSELARNHSKLIRVGCVDAAPASALSRWIRSLGAIQMYLIRLIFLTDKLEPCRRRLQ